mgnify:CR=1 FL=1
MKTEYPFLFSFLYNWAADYILLLFVKKDLYPEIKNRTIRSFLYYVPYVTLAVMTFPAILSATGSIYSAWAALIVGVLLAFKGRSLFQVAVFSCIVVFVLELFIC